MAEEPPCWQLLVAEGCIIPKKKNIQGLSNSVPSHCSICKIRSSRGIWQSRWPSFKFNLISFILNMLDNGCINSSVQKRWHVRGIRLSWTYQRNLQGNGGCKTEQQWPVSSVAWSNKCGWYPQATRADSEDLLHPRAILEALAELLWQI